MTELRDLIMLVTVGPGRVGKGVGGEKVKLP